MYLQTRILQFHHSTTSQDSIGWWLPHIKGLEFQSVAMCDLEQPVCALFEEIESMLSKEQYQLPTSLYYIQHVTFPDQRIRVFRKYLLRSCHLSQAQNIWVFVCFCQQNDCKTLPKASFEIRMVPCHFLLSLGAATSSAARSLSQISWREHVKYHCFYRIIK